MAQGKKYRDALKRFDRERLHSPSEALELVRSLAKANFDETVELVVRLGVDPRKADQIVRGTVGLPAGTGKDVRVAVFAAGEAAVLGQQCRARAAEALTHLVDHGDLLRSRILHDTSSHVLGRSRGANAHAHGRRACRRGCTEESACSGGPGGPLRPEGHRRSSASEGFGCG